MRNVLTRDKPLEFIFKEVPNKKNSQMQNRTVHDTIIYNTKRTKQTTCKHLNSKRRDLWPSAERMKSKLWVPAANQYVHICGKHFITG